jgi:predicted DNA-binding transcriptional regulator AlpA
MTMDMIDTKAIAEIVGVTRRHVTERLTKEPTFPAPVINLSRKTRRWSREQVMAWLTAGRQSARPTPCSSSAGAAAGPGAR